MRRDDYSVRVPNGAAFTHLVDVLSAALARRRASSTAQELDDAADAMMEIVSSSSRIGSLVSGEFTGEAAMDERQRGVRHMAVITGAPAGSVIGPRDSKPCRAYRASLRGFELSR